MRKILVTGAAGYIGSVLIRQLIDKQYSVVGLDILKFGGDSLLSLLNHPNFKFIPGDIRKDSDLVEALKDVDGIIHLAAIVGDPACARSPEVAEETNWKGSKKLFDLAVESGHVKRFIFASTCSNYGKVYDGGLVNENSPLNPVSFYATMKVKFEKYVLDSVTRPDFIPTALRFATVYGLSPRMRFDLTVNEFIREVTFNRELKIFGEQFWRPYCHVNDIARACITVLESKNEKIDHEVFNVGNTSENYQKKMIADEILKIVHDAKITFVPKEEDPRDYKVDFSKITELLNFNITQTVPSGLVEIYNMLKAGILSDPFNLKYLNI
jgi:nucleoside-diphosphate-sugar epimerase